jgi:hypothetical protein
MVSSDMVGKMVAVAAARYETGSFNFNDIVNNLKQAICLCYVEKLYVLFFILLFLRYTNIFCFFDE